MLLRLNFLASQQRFAFWRANPPGVYVLPRRPSFALSLRCKCCGYRRMVALHAKYRRRCPRCGNLLDVTHGDSCEYAWFLWKRGHENRWGVLDVEPGARSRGSKEP